MNKTTKNGVEVNPRAIYGTGDVAQHPQIAPSAFVGQIRDLRIPAVEREREQIRQAISGMLARFGRKP